MPRTIHFEITADDPARAAAFYRSALGWEITSWDGAGVEYLLVSTGDVAAAGIDGAIMRRQPSMDGTINTIEVPSIEDYRTRILAAGGVVLSSVQTIPGIGRHCYCQDTEGNVFGILEAARSGA